MRLKHWFFITTGIIFLWFLFVERTILTPFVLAGIFAYIFNPVITFLQKKLKFPRAIGILVVYVFILGIIITGGAFLIKKISDESVDINKLVTNAIDQARNQVYSLPSWLQPLVSDMLLTLRKSRFIELLKTLNLFPLFSQAISRIISFFIFLFSSYYFLKDGDQFTNRILSFVPNKYKIEIEILTRKANSVLGGYLRGQIFLIFLISLVLYIALSILGIKFALTLAIFSGFAEIVPVVGPIFAGSVAVAVVLLTGTSNFDFNILQLSLIVVLIYFVLRQLEDYFIIPHVMERVTKLPPFIIFFSVIAGGHIAGILGLVLAVPIAGVLKIFLEFCMDKIEAEKLS